MSLKANHARRAFVIAELAAVTVVVLVIVALALPMARRARVAGWDAVDAENLHRFAAATGTYAADNEDTYWTFSWRKGDPLPSQYEDLKHQGYTDQAAGAAQAIDILRRKAGREDIAYIPSWLSQPFYSQLPLYDYLDQEMPALWGVCPADRHRLDWAGDPAGFDQGVFLPCQPSPGNTNKRWPYSSSYELSTSFYDQSYVGSRLYQAGVENLYFIPTEAELHGRRMGETAFPSQKVHLFERQEHHLGEGSGDDCDDPRLFLAPGSRIAAVFADGHTGWMKTSEANLGWQPNSPSSPDPTWVGYGEGAYSPGVYRWTRGYLAGRDFGGPEVGPP